MPKKDQGVNSDRYNIIPRSLIFLVRKNQILLIRANPTKRLWANKYNGIGGHIEKGEDVLSAARRELLEETGLEVPNLWLCGTVMIDAGEKTGIGIFIFKGETDQEKTTTSLEGVLEWVEMDYVTRLPLVEDLPVLLPKVFAAEQGRPPFHARYSYDADENLIIQFGE
jgi:8-oxo-dGTP diphosphatase